MGTRRVISRSTIQDLNYSAPTKKAIGESTTVIIAANANRRYLCIVNDSNQPVYLAVGASAVMNSGVRINAEGGVFELVGGNMSTQAVNGIATGGDKNVTVQEAV